MQDGDWAEITLAWTLNASVKSTNIALDLISGPFKILLVLQKPWENAKIFSILK